MSNFDWDSEFQKRKAELSRVPAEKRARSLLAALKEAGFLRAHELGANDELFQFTVDRMQKWRAIEAFVVLNHAGETVSLEIEGDYYEGGSYARVIKRLFELTQGDIDATIIRDQIDHSSDTVTVFFDWHGTPCELQSKAPDGVMDYFDAGILRQVNRMLEARGIARRFVSFLDAEVQFSGWVYLDPARRSQLEAKRLLIFSESLPYSPEALSFLW